ncbi:MAG: TM2 domain-containing protein [Lachnospiraceae bacterium]|nr:TM2 domain-containing protein [Lachnospiraceae bacterium]
MSDLGDEKIFPEGENSDNTLSQDEAAPENDFAEAEVFDAPPAEEVVEETFADSGVYDGTSEVFEGEVLQGEVVDSVESGSAGEAVEGEVLQGEVVDDGPAPEAQQTGKAPKYVGAADDYDESSHITGCSITEKLMKQAEKEKEFKKSNRKGRLWSMLLMLSLIFLSFTSCGLLIRTTLQVITYYSANEVLESEAVTGFLEDSGYSKPIVDFVEGVWNFIRSISVVVGVVQWLVFGISLLITIVLLIIITRIAKKQSVIHEELLTLRAVQPPQVKRFWYVLLAWILGNFGLHLFMTDQKKRGVIFVILGFLGLIFWPISLYTMAVSFYDGMAAMYLPKESTKKVTVIISTGVL